MAELPPDQAANDGAQVLLAAEQAERWALAIYKDFSVFEDKWNENPMEAFAMLLQKASADDREFRQANDRLRTLMDDWEGDLHKELRHTVDPTWDIVRRTGPEGWKQIEAFNARIIQSRSSVQSLVVSWKNGLTVIKAFSVAQGKGDELKGMKKAVDDLLRTIVSLIGEEKRFIQFIREMEDWLKDYAARSPELDHYISLSMEGGRSQKLHDLIRGTGRYSAGYSAADRTLIFNRWARSSSIKVIEKLEAPNMTLTFDFSGFRFKNCNLAGSIFKNSCLRQTVFEGGSLAGADFTQCILYNLNDPNRGIENAIFLETNLENAKLNNIIIRQVAFKARDFNGGYVVLRNAKFTKSSTESSTGSSLENVTFFHPDLQGADFSHTHMEFVDFGWGQYGPLDFTGMQGNMVRFNPGIKLNGSTFKDVKLSKCDFMGVELKDAKFLGEYCRECNFTRAQLNNAQFENIDLKGSTFLEAAQKDMKKKNVKNAKF